MANARSKLFVFVAALVAFASGAVTFFNKDRIEFPVKSVLEYQEPYIVRDSGDLRYVLDKQRTRIVVVQKDTNVIKCVLPEGTKDADTFYYADDFMVDEKGWVYVKEGAWDGNRISREAVLVYDAEGRYKATYLDIKHSTVTNKHKMMLLSVQNGKIVCSFKNSKSVGITRLDVQSGSKVKEEYAFENAYDFVADMSLDGDGNVCLLDKAGQIFVLKKDRGFVRVYKGNDDEYLNWIEPSGAEKLLCAELYSDRVVELDLQNGEKRTVLDNSGAVTVTPVSLSALETPAKNSKMLRLEGALVAALCLFLLSALLLVVALVASFFRTQVKVIQRISVYVTLLILVVAGTITYKLTGEFSKVMRVQILAQMENMAYSVANTIRPSTLDSIQSAADFASPEYREMIENMQSIIDPTL
ncbi:MAG: hypothetical protein J6X95_08200, partial [Treponema sp.]|nr:hypothetical protein [Treponema sp.]